MKILQLNFNHCEAAQEHLTQKVRVLEVGIAILSENYKDIGVPGFRTLLDVQLFELAGTFLFRESRVYRRLDSSGPKWKLYTSTVCKLHQVPHRMN